MAQTRFTRAAEGLDTVLRLITFGGLTLLQDGEPHVGPASQRRRLAVLALVAASGQRGISREKLLGLLWPDSEPEAARHALYQALHVLRRALNADRLFLGTTSLQLNGDVISADVVEFDQAIGRRAYERAVSLYAGPFLDGFHLERLDEFERWSELERVRRAQDYASALETLASAAVARHDHVSSVQWWRRLAAAEPLSAKAALGLIGALVAAGDRVGALQFATVHSTLVRQHLDVPPDAAIEKWIERLRAEEPSPSSAPRGPRVTTESPHVRASLESGDADTEARRQLEQVKRALGDRYVVKEKIAEGTVLLTYAARDRYDTRMVELNILNPLLTALAAGERALLALQRAASLHHPRIAPVYDCGIAGGILYFGTAPADGPTLRDRLSRDRQLPLDEALRIALDLAGALEYAHERGVWHGDLRPKHVVMTPTGILVTAFGLLEALDAAVTGSHAGTTAITIGAPAYLSPEQLAGETAADARSDLYSFGCIVYEMLAGEPPFGAASQYAVLSRKLTQSPPSVREMRESVPEPLDRIITRCLARLPVDRYRTASELRQALGSLRESIGV